MSSTMQIEAVVIDNLAATIETLVDVEEVRDGVRMAEGYGPDMLVRYWRVSPESIRLDCTALISVGFEIEPTAVFIRDQHGDLIHVHCEPGPIQLIDGREIVEWELEAIGPAT